MACNIIIPLTKSPDEIISKAKQAIESQGGSFSGDNLQGNFSVPVPLGKVAAEYSISGQQLQINVTQKPFIVSCRKIESFLREQLAD
jgi:hypothetical protein